MANSAAPPQFTLEPGTKIDRYELLCHLATGGMANVWLARMHSKPEFAKLFAIKTILPSEADNAQFRDMFLDETRLVSRIDHPNVVRVTDVGEHHGLPYLVMELIEGEPLDKIVRDLARKGAKVPLGVALRIVADTCNGLAAAHDLRDAGGTHLNVVHRDVSPHNILVTTSGLSKVIDFGIAKARDRAGGKTDVGILKGKYSYMPVEQAQGREVDARTDTWALGAVLYLLFAGRPPHKGESQLEILRLAMCGGPIEALPDAVPAAVRALVTKALAHDKAKRFQSAAEMAAAIESVIREAGVTDASSNDVGTFVKQTMHARLAARAAIVSKVLVESTNRESRRLATAIPVDLADGFEDDRPSESKSRPAFSWGSVSGSGGRPAFSPPSPSRMWAALVALAVLTIAVTSIVAITRARPAPSVAAPAPSAQPDLVTPTTDGSAAVSSPAIAVPVLKIASVSSAQPSTPPRAVARPARPADPPTAAPGAKPPKPSAKSRDDETGF